MKKKFFEKRKSVSRRNLTFNWTNIEYIVIEIFLKERKKIKKEKNRRRPFIVLSENSQRNSCHASRALEGNGSDARRASTAKRKRGKEKKKEKSTEERLIFPKIEFPPTRSNWVRPSLDEKFLEAKGLQQAIVRVSYRTITRNTPCQRQRASAINGQASKRNLRAKETRRKGERGKEKDIYIHKYIYIYIRERVTTA